MIKWFKEKITYIVDGPVALLIQKLDDKQPGSLYIYGAGKMGRAVYESLSQRQKESVVAFYDRSAEFMDLEVDGNQVLPPEQIREIEKGNIIVASEAFKNEILEFLAHRIKSNNVSIIAL